MRELMSERTFWIGMAILGVVLALMLPRVRNEIEYVYNVSALHLYAWTHGILPWFVL